MIRAALLLLLMGLAWPAAAGALTPLDAHYVLSRGVLTLGTARFQLNPAGADGCWRYEYQANPTGLARLFIGEVNERSEFCVVDGEVRSSSFEFRRADDPSKNFSLEFDWTARTVRSSGGEMRQIEGGMVDRLAMQIAIQRWVKARSGHPGAEELSVTQVEDKRAKVYRFRITGREMIESPAGKFDTVRVERVDDPKKSTRFWLAPGADYRAVRVEQTRKGDEQFKMLLQ